MKERKWISSLSGSLIKLWPVWLGAVVVLTLWASLGLERLTMDSSNESFMPQGDPVTLQNDAFQEIFGNEEFFYILVEMPELYSIEAMDILGTLENDLWENLPFVADIISPYSVELMHSQDGFLEVYSIEEEGIPEDLAEMEILREVQMSSLLIPGRIVDAQGKMAGILVNMEEIPQEVWAKVDAGYSSIGQEVLTRDQAVLAGEILFEEPVEDGWVLLEDPRKDCAATLIAILEEYRSDDLKLTVTGLPYIDQQVDVLITSETGFFGLLALGAAALLLVILFREWRALIAPLLVFLLTLLLVFGTMGWLGMKISLLIIVVVPLLLVISVGYSIHVIHQIRRAAGQFKGRKELLLHAYKQTLWPCLVTAITTAAGFISFLFVPMKPIGDLGLMSALGTMTALCYVMILVPLFYRYGRIPRAEEKTYGQFWNKWNQVIFRRKKLVLLISLVLIIGSVLGILRIHPSSDMLKVVGDRNSFVEESLYLSERLGGAYSAEFLIELPEDDMAWEPEVLNTLVEARERAEEMEQVGLSLSLADFVLELDRVLFERTRPDKAEIPENSMGVAQSLMFYEMAGGEALEDWTDLNYRTLRLSVLLKNAQSDLTQLSDRILGFLQEEMPQGTQVAMTGDMAVMIRMMELIIQSQIRSCLAALLFIALLLLFILKGIRVGLIAMIPNLFAIAGTLGIMGWLGYPLDFVTAMTAPMLIGIAVDDTVHFFLHYRERRLSHGDESPRESSLAVFKTVGNALVFTSIVLCGGFFLFIFSKVESLRHLGVLTFSGITLALFADLVLSPVLLEGLGERRSIKEISKRRVS